MNQRPLTMVVSAAAVCTVMLAIALARHGSAARALRSADQRLQSVHADAQELLRLRASSPSTAEELPPDDSLMSHVRASLARADLPDTRLSQLSRPPDKPLRSAGNGAEGVSLVTRTEVIVLEPITLPELGGWLSEWRVSQPEWIPTQIDLRACVGTPAAYSATVHLSRVCSSGKIAGTGT